jgi:hypothetical protein
MFKPFAPRIIFAWILSAPVAYFVGGFLGNYYPSFLEIVFLAFLAQTVVGLLIYRLLGKAENLYAKNRWDFSLALILFVLLTIFVVEMFNAANRFPVLFNAGYILLESSQFVPYIIGCALALPGIIFAEKFLKQKNFQQTRLYQFINETLMGILVAAFFFAVYFIFSFTFNQPVFNVDDIFFDSDAWNWRIRLTTSAYQDFYWRAVHPFALLAFRPVVAFGSFFLKGDRLAAALFLVAFSGALCVFLAWYFVKQKTGSSLYAALIASLLGGSAAHLVYGSLLETYIFLALISIAVIVLLLKDTPLYIFIATGLLSFGITLSSFIQPSIVFALQRRNFKQWIIYGAVIAALTIPLTLLNNVAYPKSQPYFFDPASYDTEGRNTFEPTIRRATIVARVMFLHSIVAPDPLVISRELKFFKIWIVDVNRKVYRLDPDHLRVSEYETKFGRALALAWILFAGLGVFLFLKNILKEDNWFSYAFILIILFSFIFHQKFGKELFLYATNWTYAIIFFLALAWKEFADKKWFQIALLVFITLMLANNARLLFMMLGASALVIH